MKIAILDTSALMSLYVLNLLDKLNIFFDKVLVPRKVEYEFLNKFPDPTDSVDTRFRFIEKFYTDNYTWFLRCNEYSNDLIALYKTIPKIDDGEAEVFAQNQYWENICELILDDAGARRVAQQKSFKIKGVLKLLAILDIHGVCQYFESIHFLKTSSRNAFISEKLAKEVYDSTCNELL